MPAIIFSILKIIGISLLGLLGLLLALLLLFLFVPVRYRLKAVRDLEHEIGFCVHIKVTWLLQLVSFTLHYQDTLCMKARLFFFPFFSYPEEEEKKKKREAVRKKKEERSKKKSGKKQKEALPKNRPEAKAEAEGTETGKETEKAQKRTDGPLKETGEQGKEEEKERLFESQPEEKAKIFEFFKKLWKILTNIKYTIKQIYDKIKHIIKNIRYYGRIIQSDSFQRAWRLCSSEVFSLIKSILPGKVRGHIRIGTGDPAGTAQILAVHGMLYPFIGDSISIVPDFEETVLEGDLYLKGRITVFRFLKTAFRIYFNQDLKKVIRLFKREAV